MQNRRLKPGEWIAMSPEDQIKWKRFLQRRWRQKHPDWVKQANKHWSEFYKKIKPHLLTCRICGANFESARNARRLCDSCLANRHKRRVAIKQKILEKRKAREKTLQDIIQMWQSRITQTEIAKKYNRTQSGVSALLRRKGIIKKLENNKKSIKIKRQKGE